jgi:hypothetical protein
MRLSDEKWGVKGWDITGVIAGAAGEGMQKVGDVLSETIPNLQKSREVRKDGPTAKNEDNGPPIGKVGGF